MLIARKRGPAKGSASLATDDRHNAGSGTNLMLPSVEGTKYGAKLEYGWSILGV